MRYHVAMRVLEYLDEEGRSPFGAWFAALDAVAAARITVAVTRLENGNTGSAKGVGAGVSELRVNFGPGYRVYFGMDGPALILLLGGGSKRRQQNDIERAIARWRRYATEKKRM
jgi:putative addiction module killer protein